MNDTELRRLRDAILRNRGGERFSFWELLSQQGYEIEVAFLYGKVFCPELIEVDGYVLVAENYDDDYYRRVLQEVGGAHLEATINTTYLRNIFGDGDAEDAVWEALGCMLTQSWKSFAEAMFPGRRFRSEFSWYSELGDPAITLYQWGPLPEGRGRACCAGTGQ